MNPEDTEKSCPFQPTDYGFVLLPKINPQGVEHYELNNHSGVDGTHDFARLNTYLARDGDFVNIWHGAVDSLGMQIFLEKHGIDFQQEDEKLFRGYIATKGDADVILAALRYEKMQPSHYVLNNEDKLVNKTLT